MAIPDALAQLTNLQHLDLGATSCQPNGKPRFAAAMRSKLVVTEIELLEVGELGERIRNRRQLVATEIEGRAEESARFINSLVRRQ